MDFMEPKSKRFEDRCRLNPLAAGLNLSPGLKTDASSKEIEEAMKRVREAQSLISAAIEPGSKSPQFCTFVSSLFWGKIGHLFPFLRAVSFWINQPFISVWS